MIATTLHRLEQLCTIIPPLLNAISGDAFSCKTAPGKWSKKQLLGHLIDSATNNHQRFVRMQFEEDPVIVYDQEQWNRYSFHQQMEQQELINFWAVYNRHLLHLLRLIPQEQLQRTCKNKEGISLTLEFIIRDYVAHLEHHLQKLVTY